MRIHRASGSSSGNSSSTARSVAAMSFGSPDSAAQRNGPLPSQKSGRMYAGTKPGEVERPLVAVQLGLAADRVAVVEHLGARVHGSPTIASTCVAIDSRARIGEPFGSSARRGVPVLERHPDAAGRTAGRARRSGRSRRRSRTPRRSSSGSTSARCRAAPPTAGAGRGLRGSATSAGRRPGRRPPRRGSARSTRRSSRETVDVDDRQTPSFMVTASGCAPPMPTAGRR